MGYTGLRLPVVVWRQPTEGQHSTNVEPDLAVVTVRRGDCIPGLLEKDFPPAG
jgi:hypothetical protein